jgi:hypothetical protein
MEGLTADIVELCLACRPLWPVSTSTKLRYVDDRVAQFGFLNFVQIQISRYTLRKRWHGAVHRRSALTLDLAVSTILSMWHIKTALIHLIRQHVAHVTVCLCLTVVQHDLLVTLIAIFQWVTETFSTCSTSWHRWILLLRNACRLLINLNLVQINGQLTIALVINIAPVIINWTCLTSIIIVMAITVTIIIINTTLR